MSPAVGRETIEPLMPKQNPQRRRISLAGGVYADIGVIRSIAIAVKGRAPVFARPGSRVFGLADADGGQAPALQRKLG